MIYVLILWDKRDKYYADNSMEKQKATQKSALSVFSVGQMLVIPYFKDIYKKLVITFTYLCLSISSLRLNASLEAHSTQLSAYQNE